MEFPLEDFNVALSELGAERKSGKEREIVHTIDSWSKTRAINHLSDSIALLLFMGHDPDQIINGQLATALLIGIRIGRMQATRDLMRDVITAHEEGEKK